MNPLLILSARGVPVAATKYERPSFAGEVERDRLVAESSIPQSCGVSPASEPQDESGSTTITRMHLRFASATRRSLDSSTCRCCCCCAHTREKVSHRDLDAL